MGSGGPARWRFRLAAAGVQVWQAAHLFRDLGAQTCHFVTL
ncbi:hypothetical protein DFR50_13723 [Roseiarcus fermentans]|uniref:Uncharacterized protein n=1 Tax=Roseiarcus fermentans TaxID=1473586 RepID=A0A366ERM1_9HYPH|nr:hypothetical protein DFR50_13723 [Roseiarcus fermentans]